MSGPCDKLREVMSTQYDLVEDYDTDAVSVTSTAPDDEAFYDADCIIAENIEEDACYLVKWENYPLHEYIQIVLEVLHS